MNAKNTVSTFDRENTKGWLHNSLHEQPGQRRVPKLVDIYVFKKKYI